MDNIGASLSPLEWSEGLTKAAADNVQAWAEEEDADSLRQRMKTYGAFAAKTKYVESVFDFKIYAADGIDFTRLLLTE